MTDREKELEALAARLARKLEGLKPFICADAKCKERKMLNAKSVKEGIFALIADIS